MVRQARLIYCVYHRLHVSTYLQVIFRPFDKIVRNCYACWDPIMLSVLFKDQGLTAQSTLSNSVTQTNYFRLYRAKFVVRSEIKAKYTLWAGSTVLEHYAF
jgi:hypothetical protein